MVGFIFKNKNELIQFFLLKYIYIKKANITLYLIIYILSNNK